MMRTSLEHPSSGKRGIYPKRRPSTIYFTSGTVGYPKMVLQPKLPGHGHTISAKYWHDLTDIDLMWTLSDTGWAKAAYGSCLDNGLWGLR
ncbi:MAG: hypothetical protein CM1200mP27_13260 [Chloroflexota bacterium]|nr:MAG: hypothetical protein CM1200mP27_13260 [Chloroflexota bacterium]